MKRPLFWLHTLIAIIGLVVCAVLLMARSGHPPGIVFLPYALVAWLMIHIFLGFIQVLASQGNKYTFKQGKELSSWPVALVIVVAGCGIFFLYSLGGMVSWWLSNEAWRSHRTVYLIVQIVAFICLSGILLRRCWGLLIAGIS
jgi:hypothetical protein